VFWEDILFECRGVYDDKSLIIREEGNARGVVPLRFNDGHECHWKGRFVEIPTCREILTLEVCIALLLLLPLLLGEN